MKFLPTELFLAGWGLLHAIDLLRLLWWRNTTYGSGVDPEMLDAFLVVTGSPPLGSQIRIRACAVTACALSLAAFVFLEVML